MTAVVVALSLGGGPQVPPQPASPPVPVQGPVRDPGRRPPPEATGTGVIRGRVVAADTGNPIRRASVNLSMSAPPIELGTPPPAPGGGRGSVPLGTPATVVTSVQFSQGGMVRPRSATTDAQGNFEFRDLPRGSYRLMVQPGQYSAGYLSLAFGAKKPNTPGSTDPGALIDLADGQAFDKATIALPRGGVITGRVTDDNGEALARVNVYSVMYQPGSSRGMRMGNATTDDLGQFRIYGLVPGDYAVAAEARGNTYVNPNAPPFETEEDKIGFMTTFFPSTADEAAAQRVRARAGGETPGIEIRIVSGRLFRINGMTVDSQGRALARANGTLVKRTPNMAATASFGFSTDEQGRFNMRNIPPGEYRLVVRQQIPRPNGMNEGPPEIGEFAAMPVSVNSDLDNILVTTSPGATITGNVVFENGPPQLPPAQQSFQMRVNVSVGDAERMTGAPMPPAALVAPDLTFTMKGLSGEVLLRSSAPGNVLKAVLVGGDDITDTPHEFRSGERVTLVLTSRASTLEGAVTDAAGKPVTDAALILFSDDKAAWRTNSLRTRRGNSDQAGHFRMLGVLPGRYFLVAMPRDRMAAFAIGLDASAFETLAKEATTVVVGEDEQRQVDVKISAGGGH
jgi:protocatechuate 3,4-dioxygenase beta subunit